MTTNDMPIGRGLAISRKDLEERFILASGPGGQNVNKSATAVQLRFDLRGSQLPAAVKRRAARLAGTRLSSDGSILIRAQAHRMLSANRADAEAKLLALLKQATTPPAPRVKTRPSRTARRRRADNKVKRGAKKKLRGKPQID